MEGRKGFPLPAHALFPHQDDNVDHFSQAP